MKQNPRTRNYLWWLGPALVSLALVLLFRDPFIGDWDAVDYTVLAVRGEPSSMALGRLLFVGYNHLLWRAAHSVFGLQAENAHLLFQFAVVAQAPLATIACGVLARAVTESRHVATLAALLVGTSPAFVIYGGQVMTEIPSLLVTTCAMLIYWHGIQTQRPGLKFVGAALLGAGVNLRETVAFFALWLLLAPFAARKELESERAEDKTNAPVTLLRMVFLPFSRSPLLPLFLFALFAFGPFALWYGLDVGNYRASWQGWLASLQLESARHPVTWRNLWPFTVMALAAASPVFLLWPAAMFAERRRNGFSASFALGVCGLAATALLFFNYSTTINARYFLSGLPALAPVVVSFLLARLASFTGDKRRAFAYALACVCVVAVARDAFIFIRQERLTPNRLANRSYRDKLAQLPSDAIVMAGTQTVAVHYWHNLGFGQWETIGTGGGWPGTQLVPLIQNYLNKGRRVFLDTDPRGWVVCGWAAEETRQLPALQNHFRFRGHAPLYEFCRPDAADCAANPNLAALLPERRPQDVALCFAPGR